MNTDTEYLTVEEVAARLHVSTRTVRRWISAGTLPSVRAGRRVLVDAADITAFLTGGAR